MAGECPGIAIYRYSVHYSPHFLFLINHSGGFQDNFEQLIPVISTPYRLQEGHLRLRLRRPPSETDILYDTQYNEAHSTGNFQYMGGGLACLPVRIEVASRRNPRAIQEI